jgi:3-oxoacyl-[acyl-carrier-protein] synthase-1
MVPSRRRLAILNTGLVCPVGLNAPAACAAIRAGVTNPSETRFMDSEGKWLTAHSVPLDHPWRVKLAKMAALAIAECSAAVPAGELATMPLILCVYERLEEFQAQLGGSLLEQIQAELGVRFASEPIVVAKGRAAVGTALLHARRLVYEQGAPFVIIAATDSLLTWQRLAEFVRADRLLTPRNSNGFLPGEAAAALLVSADAGHEGVVCTGVGLATEPATVSSEEPLRGDGLAAAIRAALAEAGCEMHQMDLRVADLSGERYYFKEATLAVSRLLRTRKVRFDLWHPAECIGETGAAAGVAALIVADTACRRGYAPGHNVLTHLAADGGERVALVLQHRTSQ